jgi:siroheme synthase (precorrin-2 oxidase/ferrochelatase)
MMICLKDSFRFLVAGAGEKAFSIINLLSAFTKNFYVVSKNIDKDFEAHLNGERTEYIKDKLKLKYLSDANFIIICEEDDLEYKSAFDVAKHSNLPLWCFSKSEYPSSFYIPSTIKTDELIMGVSSSGVSEELESIFLSKLEGVIDFKLSGIIRKIKSKKEYYNLRIGDKHKKAFWKELIAFALENYQKPKAFEEEAGRLFVKYRKLS